MKTHGGEIQIFDMNHVGDAEYEMNQYDLRLMGVAEDIRLGHKSSRSSLDDPISDRTVSSVKPSSPLENAHVDWLSQRPPNSEHVQLQDDQPLRNYHGRIRESFVETDPDDSENVSLEEVTNKKEPQDLMNYDMMISPVEQSYSKT